MGNLWVFLMAPAAVLGAWIFFSTYGQQKSDQNVIQIEHRRDKAEFDRDFAKGWDGKPSAELEKRASEANQKLVTAIDEKAKEDAKRKAEQDREKQQLGALLSAGTAPAKEQK